MKNHPERKKISIIAGKGEGFGNGHFLRMELLKKRLEKENHPVRLIEYTKAESYSYDEADWVLLDSRDESFPYAVLNNKSPLSRLMAIDNRGEGRNQASDIWDTLPHYNMSLVELQGSLTRFIVSEILKKDNYLPPRFNIKYVDLSEFQSRKIDLIQTPYDPRFSQEKFQEKLLEAKSVATYFGQTFFEALYLGKEVYLYDITDYHKSLSQWFFKMSSENPELCQYLDGSGMDKLINYLA